MENREGPEEAVLNFLSLKGTIPGKNHEEKLKCAYLQAGILDSFGIVEMVMEFESKFGIRFLPQHMQSDEFRVIGGLVGLIEQLIIEKNHSPLKENAQNE